MYKKGFHSFEVIFIVVEELWDAYIAHLSCMMKRIPLMMMVIF
jgi:hypothetical protein